MKRRVVEIRNGSHGTFQTVSNWFTLIKNHPGDFFKTRAKGSTRTMRPAATPEARENQLVSLAVELAEKQLLDGTASSQVITHYLKLGSTKEKLDYEFKRKQMDLIEAKTESLQSAQRVEELYKNALDAMKSYSGGISGANDYDE